MSGKKYTLTVYLAAPGTPMLNANKQIEYSLPGHAYYAVSDGVTKQGFGFAPTGKTVWERMNGPADVHPNEYTKYQNPQYERTMEITEAQYNALLSFVKRPKETAGFNKDHYNFAHNSCVDFLFTALKHSGIYKGQKTSFTDEMGGEHSYINPHYEGAIKVLPNIRELENISDPIPGSPLNKTIHRDPPKQNTLQKLLNENEQEQPYQYAGADRLTFDDIPDTAKKLYTQTEEKMRAFYKEFDIPYQEQELKNAAAALAAVAYEKKLPEVQDFELHNGRMVAFWESRGGAYKEALLDADFANHKSQLESFARMIETEPKLEEAARQRAMEIAAYEQSQSMGRSIG